MRVRVLYAWDGNDRPHPPNSIVELDDAEATGRIAAGHVEQVDAATARLYAAEEPEAPAEPAAPAEDADPGGSGATPPSPDLLGGTVAEVAAHVAELADPGAIAELRAAEEAGRSRKGVLAALTARAEVLEGGAGETAPDGG